VRGWSAARDAAELSRTSPAIDARDAAGDEGERLALAALRRLLSGRGSAAFFPALRCPKSDARGKHEIDLVVLCRTALLAIEVKHWSGEIRRDPDGRFAQVGAATKVHADPLALITAKAHDLGRYLEQQGWPIEARRLVPLLLFTHPGARLTPELEAEPAVARPETLTRRLAGHLPRRLPPPLSALFARGGEFGRRFASYRDALARLPTWDRARLRSGAELKGDFEDFRIELAGGRTLERTRVLSATLHTPRSPLLCWLLGTRLSWRGRPGQGGGRGRPRPGQGLDLALAGRSHTLRLPLEQLRSIELGWADQRYYDAPRRPLEQYQRGQHFEGPVTGCVEFGVFVRFDAGRDGLLPMRALAARGRRPLDFEPGQRLEVRFVSARTRPDGKEEVELDLA
jgi:hypothetical protein